MKVVGDLSSLGSTAGILENLQATRRSHRQRAKYVFSVLLCSYREHMTRGCKVWGVPNGGVTVGDCSLWRLCKLDTAKIPEAHKVGDRESNELSR